MQLSPFLYVRPHGDMCLVFNRSNGALVALPLPQWEALVEALRLGHTLPPEMPREELLDQELIVDDDFTVEGFNREAFSHPLELSNVFNLILETGLSCNFGCTYCYQTPYAKTSRVTYSIPDVIGRLTSMLEREHYDKLRVEYIGGEPTLNGEFILHSLEILKTWATSRELPQTFALDTNGSLLTKEIVKHFDVVAVTLSLSHDHNLLRPLRGGAASYDSVVSNLVSVAPVANEHNSTLQLRYNLHDGNARDYPAFVELARRMLPWKRLVFEVAPIINHFGNKRVEPVSLDDLRAATLASWEANGSLPDFHPTFGPCGAYAPAGQLKINYNGDATLCNEDIRSSGVSVMDYHDLGSLWEALGGKELRQISDIPECMSCADLGMCGGRTFCRGIDPDGLTDSCRFNRSAYLDEWLTLTARQALQ